MKKQFTTLLVAVGLLLAGVPCRAWLIGGGQGVPGASYSGPLDAITTSAAGYQCYSVTPCSAAIGAGGTTAALNVTNSTPATCDLVVGLSGTTPTLKTASGCSAGSGITAATFCGTSCTFVHWYDQQGVTNCSAAACTYGVSGGTPLLVFSGCPGTVGYCINNSSAELAPTGETTTATQTISAVWKSVTTAGDTYIVDNTGVNTYYLLRTSAPTPHLYAYNGSSFDSTYTATDGVWHSATISYNSTSAGFIDIDNTVTTGATGSGAGTGAYHLNATSQNNLFYAEVLIHPTVAMGSSDATALCHNQSTRFGLSLAC